MPETQQIPSIDVNKSAFLLLDYQNGIFDHITDSDRLIATAQKNLNYAREKNFTIGYARVAFTEQQWAEVPETNMLSAGIAANKPFPIDDPSSQILNQIKPHSHDIVVVKTRYSAFTGTTLHEQLQQKNIHTLIISGVSTSGVVLSTLVEAVDKDYRVFILSDSVFDEQQKLGDAVLTLYAPRRAYVITSEQFRQLVS